MIKTFLSIPLNKNNLKAILTKIANKPDERFKYEISREWSDSSLFKFSIWYNPIARAGYRMKPVDFKTVNQLQIELPRLYMANALIYKVWWLNRNLY